MRVFILHLKKEQKPEMFCTIFFLPAMPLIIYTGIKKLTQFINKRYLVSDIYLLK